MDIDFKKWGHSLGMVVPAGLARRLHLTPGMKASVTIEETDEAARLVIEVGQPRRRERRPLSYYFNRSKRRGLGKAAAREVLETTGPRGRELW